MTAGVLRDALGLDSLTELVSGYPSCQGNPCSPVVKEVKLPLPCCRPCSVPEECPHKDCKDCPSVDYNEAKSVGTGKALEILVKGKSLASDLAAKVAAPFVYKYDLISSAASGLPDVLATKGHLTGQVLTAPIDFSIKKSALLAKGLAHVVVGVPTAIGTGIYAGAAGLIDAYNNVQEQKERINDCLNPTSKKEEKVIVHASSSEEFQADQGHGHDESSTVTSDVVPAEKSDSCSGCTVRSEEVTPASPTDPSSMDVLSGGIL